MSICSHLRIHNMECAIPLSNRRYPQRGRPKLSTCSRGDANRSDNGSATATSGRNALVKTRRKLTTKTATTMRRQEPEQGWAVQLPEGRFDHPFQDLAGHYMYSQCQEEERPRTVSTGCSKTTVRFPHHSTRSSNCGCVPSLITSEKDPTGGRR